MWNMIHTYHRSTLKVLFPPLDSAFSRPAVGQHNESTLHEGLIRGLGRGSQAWDAPQDQLGSCETSQKLRPEMGEGGGEGRAGGRDGDVQIARYEDSHRHVKHSTGNIVK